VQAPIAASSSAFSPRRRCGDPDMALVEIHRNKARNEARPGLDLALPSRAAVGLHLPFEPSRPTSTKPAAGRDALGHRAAAVGAEGAGPAATFPDALVIGSDQVLMLDSDQLGKPAISTLPLPS